MPRIIRTPTWPGKPRRSKDVKPTNREPWVMPAWMERYRGMIGNTGGNPIEELMNDHNLSNNFIRSALIVCVDSQITLLGALHYTGLLKKGAAYKLPLKDVLHAK